MKAMKKNDGVSPVIAVILMVAITVVLAGVVFLWAQSFTDDADGDVETMNVKGSLDASDDELTIEVISGTITWADYTVTIDGTTVTSSASTSTSAGGSAVFDTTVPDLTTSTEYTVKIVNIGENKVVWEDEIIATA